MTFVVSSLTVLGDKIQTLLVATFAGLGGALLNFTRSQLPRDESQFSSITTQVRKTIACT
jgi:hypothetical protein